jgi:hypothetical protein
MTTFLELCNPFCFSLSALPSEEGWYSISELSKLHGVTPFFFYRVKSLGIPLPERIMKEWLGIYLHQIAEERNARRQIKELKEVLDSEGIPMVLLKSASAMFRLYPQPGLRTFVDLDILIPMDKVSEFKKGMGQAGYKPVGTMNSPEDEDLRKFERHLDPLWKDGGLIIEPHVNIFKGRGQHMTAFPEIWEGIEKIQNDGISFAHLKKEHFIINTLLHATIDLINRGFVEIKGFIDAIYAISVWKIDGLTIKNISQKWGIEKEILPALATLIHYWHADIPLKSNATPFDLATLVLGVKDPIKHQYENIPSGYLRRLFKMREFPDVTSRIRYLFHLFFPAQENLRWRYHLSSKWSVVPYYFLHLLVTFRKFFTGLWYQLVHPRQ